MEETSKDVGLDTKWRTPKVSPAKERNQGPSTMSERKMTKIYAKKYNQFILYLAQLPMKPKAMCDGWYHILKEIHWKCTCGSSCKLWHEAKV